MFTLGACAVSVIAGIVLVFWREQASMVRREAFDRHMVAAHKLVEECFDEVAPET